MGAAELGQKRPQTVLALFPFESSMLGGAEGESFGAGHSFRVLSFIRNVVRLYSFVMPDLIRHPVVSAAMDYSLRSPCGPY